jgi:hypothetical protein
MKIFYKVTIIIFAIVTLIFGIPLFLVPGRFLKLFNWAPIEPLISRLLGAALLAMSFTAWIDFIKPDINPIRKSLAVNFIFCTLGAIGIFRHLIAAIYYPFRVWFIFILLTIFAIAWGVLIIIDLKKRK